MLVLRCGLRVEEVARLSAHAVEFQRRQLQYLKEIGAIKRQ